MNFSSPAVILAIVAGGLAVVGIFKPSWPITSVAVLLLAIAVLVVANGK